MEGETDEFVSPTVIMQKDSPPDNPNEDAPSFNFRRQGPPDQQGFRKRNLGFGWGNIRPSFFVSMTDMIPFKGAGGLLLNI